ncbi:hypothetical protein MKK84_14500 [Methylobacterium sp. E-065]|uniref:hypothetical protein n=1 Tax=Methylobacterium sp. E-065 TaxID=2836583 RepID=UPI001FBA61EA|nr:hypothetical protein [Methylobacterium sp. E-065]MCJ2018633.1 hypothetical protein [Methylobacterium sp. E-065]
MSPGIVRRTLDQQLAAGKEPTKAAVREAVSNVVRQLRDAEAADPDVIRWALDAQLSTG